MEAGTVCLCLSAQPGSARLQHHIFSPQLFKIQQQLLLKWEGKAAEHARAAISTTAVPAVFGVLSPLSTQQSTAQGAEQQAAARGLGYLDSTDPGPWAPQDLL